MLTLTEGHRLTREALKREERNQAWLARRIGASTPLVCRWMQGHGRPSVERREKIRDLLGVPVESWDNVIARVGLPPEAA